MAFDIRNNSYVDPLYIGCIIWLYYFLIVAIELFVSGRTPFYVVMNFELLNTCENCLHDLIHTVDIFPVRADAMQVSTSINRLENNEERGVA